MEKSKSANDSLSYTFSISFVFLNSLLFCVISTVQWSGATSICDGIILVFVVRFFFVRFFQKYLFVVYFLLIFVVVNF